MLRHKILPDIQSLVLSHPVNECIFNFAFVFLKRVKIRHLCWFLSLISNANTFISRILSHKSVILCWKSCGSYFMTLSTVSWKCPKQVNGLEISGIISPRCLSPLMRLYDMYTWLNGWFQMYNHRWNASDMSNIILTHSSGGRNQIWKIMKMYLCRRCFISVWALWKIKISLCLWEERGWRREGLACVCACVNVCADKISMRFFCLFAVNVCVCAQARSQQWHRWEQNFHSKCDKRCKSWADVSFSRHPAVKSKISLLLISASFTLQLFLTSSSCSIKTTLRAFVSMCAAVHENVCWWPWDQKTT